MAKSAVKFKDSVAQFEQLQGSIKQRQYSPIYLLMGEESFFIDHLSDMLGASILNEAERAFNQTTLYGRDTDGGQVVSLCRQLPMMGSYQVVIVKEAQNLKGLDKLALYTKDPVSSTILVICHKEKGVDKRSQFYKSVLSKGVVFESIRPRDYEIGAWLTAFVKRRGLSIDAKAQSMLTDHLGTNLSKISNELDKLLVSLPEGTKQITDSDIEQNIGISKDFNNFELCKAVASKDMARAMFIADNFAHNPKDHPLLVTVMALFGQFRQMFVINYLRWQTKNKGVAFPSDMEIMRLIKANNPYVVGEVKQLSALWPNSKVFAILGLMREYDAKSKGINSGGASDGELLRELLLKIFTV